MGGKKKFIITIEEMVTEDFEVFAETEEEAVEIATEKYNSGEFVLEPGNLVSKQMEVHNVTDDEYTDWFEFVPDLLIKAEKAKDKLESFR